MTCPHVRYHARHAGALQRAADVLCYMAVIGMTEAEAMLLRVQAAPPAAETHTLGEYRRVPTPQVTYSGLLAGYVAVGRMNEAEAVLQRMQAARLMPNAVVFNTLLHGYATARPPRALRGNDDALAAAVVADAEYVGVADAAAQVGMYVYAVQMCRVCSDRVPFPFCVGAIVLLLLPPTCASRTHCM